MAVNYPESADEWREWTQKWWDSMLIIPKGSNPIKDQNGSNFKNFKQPYDQEGIWFLAGNLGGEDRRNITVKKGKVLFFPEVNFIACKDNRFGGDKSKYTFGDVENSLYINEKQGDPEKDAREDVTKSEESTSVDFKGPVKQRIRKRVQNPFWTTNFGQPPVMGGGSGPADCLSDGYWIFTEPLEAVGEKAYITIEAKHPEINDTHGRRHSFSSKVVYEIDIVP